MTIIALTGGIGAGKSVVSQVLRAMGYHVYDCDSEARRLQDASPLLRQRIAREVTPQALLPNGTLNRQAIAAEVFANPAKLQALNAIMHSAVADDFRTWCKARPHASHLFVETAILYESGFDRLVNDVWEVVAPIPLRIKRVERRSGLSPAQILSRINAQGLITPSLSHKIINNDGRTPLLPQIHQLLK